MGKYQLKSFCEFNLAFELEKYPVLPGKYMSPVHVDLRKTLTYSCLKDKQDTNSLKD